MANDEQVTKALVLLALALDIDPAAMMVAGRMTPEGYELRVLIIPDVDTETVDTASVVDEAERTIRNGR